MADRLVHVGLSLIEEVSLALTQKLFFFHLSYQITNASTTYVAKISKYG